MAGPGRRLGFIANAADSDAVRHVFQSCRTPFRACRTVIGAKRRSVQTHKQVSDKSQVAPPTLGPGSEPLGGATLLWQTLDVVAPSIRSGGERRPPFTLAPLDGFSSACSAD
jgi:hypothetical protein